METLEKNIVILGGGFAGLRAALECVRAGVDREGYHVVLVDREQHHLYTPLLYEVASAFLYDMPVKERFCLQQGVAIDFLSSALGQQLDHARIVHATVAGLEVRERLVLLENHAPIPYEYCIVALGSIVEDYGIPGVREHGFIFKSLVDALRIHEHIHGLLRRHEQGKEQHISIVIGGGGPTGVELAGELEQFCRRACKRFGLDASVFSVTLLQQADRLVPTLHPSISARARARLTDCGVRVHVDTSVSHVNKGSVTILPKGGAPETIEADMFIWSGGVCASEIVKAMPFLHDVKGRIDVEPTLQVPGEERVFVAGDSAALRDPRTQKNTPALAQTAIFQGTCAGRNVVRALRGRSLKRYTFPFLAYMIPVSGKYAFGQFGKFLLRGRFLWLVHRIVDLKYFCSILPLTSALLMWIRGWKTYVRND